MWDLRLIKLSLSILCPVRMLGDECDPQNVLCVWSQEATLNCFPTDDGCFMDVTCQMDSSIKGELGKEKGETEGLFNFCFS